MYTTDWVVQKSILQSNQFDYRGKGEPLAGVQTIRHSPLSVEVLLPQIEITVIPGLGQEHLR